jgi:glucuronokinase
MNFARHLMESRGYGEYEPLDPGLLKDIYVAYRTSLSEGTEVFHNNVRERWRNNDPIVIDAMKQWAEYAEQGRSALLRGDRPQLHKLVNANFDLRSTLYQLDPGNLEMIHLARACGASANFAGSGGAIVGLYEGESMFTQLKESMRAAGIAVIKPQMIAPS